MSGAALVIRTQASKVQQAIRAHEGVVVRIELSCHNPDVFSATPCPQHAPLVVAHGDDDDFARVLEGFLYWTMPLTVYGLYQDGLAELWVPDQ
jgi:hypothetical protein